VDERAFELYRLGLRFRQAALILGHAASGCASFDIQSGKLALAHLLIALEAASRLVDFGGLSRIGSETLGVAAHNLEIPGFPGSEVSTLAGVGESVEMLEVAFDDWARSSGRNQPGFSTWFRLGRELAKTEYCPPHARIFVTGEVEPRQHPGSESHPVWRFDNPERLRGLLAEVMSPLDQLFPESEPTDSVAEFAALLPSVRFAPAWELLEVGLRRLQSRPAPSSGRRRCWDRDHQFLRWYETRGDATYHSPAKIRSRWNALHPSEQVTRDVVVKALRLARAERGL
jgi:hypothetical protein